MTIHEEQKWVVDMTVGGKQKIPREHSSFWKAKNTKRT